VLVPLVAGVFLAVLARPLQRRVGRALPARLRWLGLVAAMLVVFAGVGAFGGALYYTGRAVAGELRDRRPRLEATVAQARQRLARSGVPASAVPGGVGAPAGRPGSGAAAGSAGGQPQPATRAGSAGGQSGAPSERAAGAPSPDSGGAAGTVRRVATGTVEALGTLLLALAFCALGLAEAGDARRRLVRAVPDRATPTVLSAVDEAVAAFRRYAWVKTLTSALTGSATALAAFALGLPLPWVWGFITFLLEYIPSVGSVLSVIRPRSWRWPTAARRAAPSPSSPSAPSRWSSATWSTRSSRGASWPCRRSWSCSRSWCGAGCGAPSARCSPSP
jgi:hypothetical protein